MSTTAWALAAPVSEPPSAIYMAIRLFSLFTSTRSLVCSAAALVPAIFTTTTAASTEVMAIARISSTSVKPAVS